MKPNLLPITVGVILLAQTGSSQNFINLDFESADVSSSFFGMVQTSDAFPGWQTEMSTVFHNYGPLDQVSVGIFDSTAAPVPVARPVFGNYTPYLAGDLGSTYATSGAVNLWQSGLIPAGANSIRFTSTSYSSIPGLNPTLRFFINNVPVSFSQFQVLPNGIEWVANVSAVAGTVSTLKFGVSESFGPVTEPNVPYYDFGIGLDNIAFSPAAAPEPSSLTLCAGAWLAMALKVIRGRSPCAPA